jgi:hypothetical protein
MQPFVAVVSAQPPEPQRERGCPREKTASPDWTPMPEEAHRYSSAAKFRPDSGLSWDEDTLAHVRGKIWKDNR